MDGKLTDTGAKRLGSEGFDADISGTDGFGADKSDAEGFGTVISGTDGFGTGKPGTDGFGAGKPGTDGFGAARMYALSLLDYAVNNDLPEIFQQIWAIVLSGKITAEGADTNELRTLLGQVPPDDLEETLLLFINMARGKMNTHKAEVISAVPLTNEQLHKLEITLIKLLRKQLDITASVDPSLLGGLRVVVDDMVIDHSVKRRLFEMKQAVYRGVYLNDGI